MGSERLHFGVACYDAGVMKRAKWVCALAMLAMVALIAVTCIVYQIPVYASGYSDIGADEDLTALFSTEAFRGSWEVIEKMNWLGMLLNYVISAFSFIGLFMLCLTRVISMLYLSNKELFDQIHDQKTGGGGGDSAGGFLGIKTMFKPITSPNTTGLDSIVQFLLGLLPDIKSYSDYKEVSDGDSGNTKYNLKSTDNCGSYIMKVSISTIMLAFFFTIGFNGSLWKAYGVVVDAMAVAADNFCDVQLDEIVDTAINSNKAYKFHFNASGSNFGKFQQKVAKDIYTKCVSVMKSRDQNALHAVGSNIENAVTKDFTKLLVRGRLGVREIDDKEGSTLASTSKDYYDKVTALPDATGTVTEFKDNELWDGNDQTAKGLGVTVVISTTKDSLAGSFPDSKYGPDVVYKLSEFVKPGIELKANQTTGNKTAEDLYVHAYITIKGTDTKKYIARRDNEVKKSEESSESGRTGKTGGL